MKLLKLPNFDWIKKNGRLIVVGLLVLGVLWLGSGKSTPTPTPTAPPEQAAVMAATTPGANPTPTLPPAAGQPTDITVVYPGKNAAEQELVSFGKQDTGSLSNYFLYKLLTQLGNSQEIAVQDVWAGANGKSWCVYKALKADPNSSLSQAITAWSSKVGNEYPNLNQTYSITVPVTALECLQK